SPEQANTTVAIDGRSDLFSVGIMLWELLADELLFAQHDDFRVAIAAVLFHPINSPALHRPDVPPELEAVALRLLQRKPDARYQTAHEARAALMACPAASHDAKTELQQLLRLRFPERAPNTPRPVAAALPAPSVGPSLLVSPPVPGPRIEPAAVASPA